jgi:acyl-CoA synthetase (AMP-forming)/AMP-acid ligase II
VPVIDDAAFATRIPHLRAGADPLGACISDARTSLTNEAFAADVARLAERLAELGVGRGDTVAVMLPNCCEIVTTMFGAWHLGAALTPVNPALTDDEVLYQLQDSASRVLVGDDRAGELAQRTGLHHIDVDSVHATSRASTPDAAAKPDEALSLGGAAARADDFALVVYTSGTTGRPKGCVLDHANVEAMVTSISEHLLLTSGDTSLLVLPLFHCNGLLISVMSVLQAGGKVVVAPRFNPTTFWQDGDKHLPTFFSAVPTMYAMLEAQPVTGVDTSSLRFVICGAAPIAPDLIEKVEARFGVPVVEGYGLSEGSVASTLNPVNGPRKVGTVGPALPGQEVEIEAPDGRRLPRGERGEVVIRGRNVMRGYLGRPQATAEVLRDGWLHTGDVGYLDEDGYLVLVDRLKDMIIRGGENIFPKEIENVLYDHPDVLEAAVVGKPDPVYGEVPVAYVAPRPGAELDVDQLIEHCHTSLARFKVPREFHVLDSLPKNAVGKLVKGQLKAPTGTS